MKYFIFNGILLIWLYLVGSLIYSQYKERQPVYKVGQCINKLSTKANEFEEAEYRMYKIIAVGEKNYKMIVYYNNNEIETVWPIYVFNNTTNVVLECPEELKGE